MNIENVYVLYFNEYGWEEGDEQSGNILGVFSDKERAEKFEKYARDENNHDFYMIKKIPINSFYKHGW